MIQPPFFLLHADWSKNENKRWMVKAIRQEDGWYAATAPQQASDLSDFIQHHAPASAAPGAAWFGFDFPIGLPKAYAELVNIPNFMSALPLFGDGAWSQFYQVAEKREEISLKRPFYPHRPGNAQRANLSTQLGLSWDNLYRQCERQTNDRPAACPLFWTLGARQVGKAAITGWKKVFAPALENEELKPRLKFWPFEGRLDELSQPGQIVIAETYPAEYYKPLEIEFKSGGKGNLTARQGKAEKLLQAAARFQIRLDEELARQIDIGFDRQHGEDDGFDAFVGLLGMAKVIQDCPASFEPDQVYIRLVEGWILGMQFK